MSTHDKNVAEERRILAAHEKVLGEEKKVERAMRMDAMVLLAAAVVIAAVATAGVLFLRTSSRQIATDKAQVLAPTIDLAPQGAGVLKELYVRPGDVVQADAAVARVGNELVKTAQGGEVVSVHDDVGKLFNRGEPVVTMIDPAQLRVVVRLEEDKGLKDVRVGQLASFTVDAFGAKRYVGTVDEVSPTSRDSGVVFSISDKRETMVYDVKIRFDAGSYPELKNGMSAKVVIYKD